MNTHLTRSFRTYFVESRFISIVFSVIIVGLRFLMYLKKGLPDAPEYVNNDVWRFIDSAISDLPILSFFGSTLLIFIISVLVSELNLRFGVIRLRTSMPFYIPLLLFSVHPVFLRMTTDLIALVFLLWSLFPLFATYQFQRSHKYAFQFTALLAMGSIFQIYTLLFVPIWLIALKALDEISFRSFFASIFGLIIVFWIVFSMYVFGDNIAGFLEPFRQLAVIYDFRSAPDFNVPQWGFVGTIILLVIIFLTADTKQIVRERSFTKKVLVFNLFVVSFVILMQVLYYTRTLFFLYVGIALVSMVISHFYTNSTRNLQVYSYIVFMALLIVYILINLFTDFSPF